METFDFSDALRKLKAGKTVARKHWSNPGKYVYYQPAEEGAAFEPRTGKRVSISAHLVWCDDLGRHVPWLPSQDAILADDWYVGVSGSSETTDEDEDSCGCIGFTHRIECKFHEPTL